MKKKINMFDIILNIIIILLGILVIYWFIQLIFGGSPSLSEFNSTLIILLASFLINIYREVGEIKTGLKYSFKEVRDNFDKVNKNIGLIKDKLKIR